MKKLLFPAMALFAIIVSAFIMLIPAKVNAQNSNSQEFYPSRFVIVAAEVNVMSPQMGGASNTQNVLVKLDTQTGRSWILQLDVQGGNEPKVRSSSWHELGFRMRN